MDTRCLGAPGALAYVLRASAIVPVAAIPYALAAPLHVPIGPPVPDSLRLVNMVIDVLLNVFTVVGIVMFAQAYRSLGPPPGLYRVGTVVAFVAGAAVVGPSR